jgi:3-(methylthio)propanoyl-CoA dehydrogenase
VRTRAEPQPDGSYKLFGTKIYITYGEHDMADNIVHLVLARVVGAPEGVKGISLFICPKFMVPDGSLQRRALREHRAQAGHQGQPHGGAAVRRPRRRRGLPGGPGEPRPRVHVHHDERRPLRVGVQGIALAERAYQKAVQYARDRVQSRPVDGSLNHRRAHHPPPRRARMLMTMRAHTEGCRAMALVAAAAYDAAHAHPDAEVRKQNQAFYEFLVPLVKGYCHRDEPGRGQPGRAGARRHGLHRGDRRGAVPARRQDPDHLRRHDRDPGQRPGRPQDGARRRPDRAAIAAQIEATEAELRPRQRRLPRPMAQAPGGRRARPSSTWWTSSPASTKASPNAVFAGSVPYLMLAGTVVAGWQMARALMAAEDRWPRAKTPTFMQAKIATARFYADHILNRGPGCATASSTAPRPSPRWPWSPSDAAAPRPHTALLQPAASPSSARRCSSSATPSS